MTEPAELLVLAEVEPERLHDLRRRVLRRAIPDSRVEDPRDADASTLHVAGLLAGLVVACASFYADAYAGAPTEPGYQLRFMAVDDEMQGRGYGASVLGEGEARLRARGCRVLWANGRDSALGFYRALGWEVVAGSEFVSAETQIPHHVMFKWLVGEGRPGAPPARH